MKLWTNLRSADGIRDAIHATEGNNLHLGKMLNGVCVVEGAYLFSSLKGQLYAASEQQRSTVLSSVYSMIKLPGSPLTSWTSLKDYDKKTVPLQVTEKRTSHPRETTLPANQTARSTKLTHNSRSIVCFRCGGPYRRRGDARRGIPACTAKCHCSICDTDTHATERHDLFEKTVRKSSANVESKKQIAVEKIQ